MIPVTVNVRSMGDGNTVRAEKTYHFNVFQQQKWTPQLMSMTLLNSLSGINELVDEATYRLSATVNFADGKNHLSLNTMQSTERSAFSRATICWPVGGARNSTACTITP